MNATELAARLARLTDAENAAAVAATRGQTAAMVALDDLVATNGTERSNMASTEEHRRRVLDLERQTKSRALAVPTDPTRIKLALRARGEPVCLYGEDNADRRERLRLLMAEEGEDAYKHHGMDLDADEGDEDAKDKVSVDDGSLGMLHELISLYRARSFG